MTDSTTRLREALSQIAADQFTSVFSRLPICAR